MKVLVVGGGGRCHAIVDALSRSPQVDKIYCAPGNAGISALAECVALKDTDVEGLKAFAIAAGIDLTVVGPEAALAVGIVDSFRAAGLKIFGHTKSATRIESSKEFAKQLMLKYDIPTASYCSFTDYAPALAYVQSHPLPAVLKYDGLAAGKGVVIARTMEEADETLKDMLLDCRFGEGKVVIEDFLTGPEFSFMCFVDGSNVYPMPLAQDHKRAFDGDKGPNTGGMGAYTSLPFITEAERKFALENILQKTADAMVSEGCPLSGVLYGGLMKTPSGIKVIEFNARFGDPETEVVLPLVKSDIYDMFHSVASSLKPAPLQWEDAVTMGVVLASKGYPGSYDKGFEIKGLDKVNDLSVYHMGTAVKDDCTVVTSGGRVMMCVAKAPSLPQAREKVYAEISKIDCPNLFYRHDIAHIAMEYKPSKVLVVVDVQRDFFDPSGSLYVSGSEALPQKIASVLPCYDAIVFTLDWHPGNHCSFKTGGGIWPSHCVAYTQGAGLPDCFGAALSRKNVRLYFKGTSADREQYGAFEDPDPAISDLFTSCDSIDVCGIAGDYCVMETVSNVIRIAGASKVTVLQALVRSIDDGTTLKDFIRKTGVKVK